MVDTSLFDVEDKAAPEKSKGIDISGFDKRTPDVAPTQGKGNINVAAEKQIAENNTDRPDLILSALDAGSAAGRGIFKAGAETIDLAGQLAAGLIDNPVTSSELAQGLSAPLDSAVSSLIGTDIRKEREDLANFLRTTLGEEADATVGEIFPEPTTTAGQVSGSIFQFLGAFAGAGKIKALDKVGKLKPALQGAVADFVGFDGQDGNLANFVQDIFEVDDGTTKKVLDVLTTSEDTGELEGRLKNAVIGTLSGEAVDKLFRFGKFVWSARNKAKATGKSTEEILDEAEVVAKDHVDRGVNPEASVDRAMRDLDPELSKDSPMLDRASGSEIRRVKKLDHAEDVANNTIGKKKVDDFTDDLVKKEAELDKLWELENPTTLRGKAKKSIISARNKVAEGARDALATYATRLHGMHPRLLGAARTAEQKFLGRVNAMRTEAEDLVKQIQATKKSDPDQFKSLSRALRSENSDLIEGTLNEGQKSAYQKVRNMLDSTLDDLRQVDPDVGEVQNFFPRTFKDPKAVVKFFRDKKMISEAESTDILNKISAGMVKGKELNDPTIAKQIRDELTKFVRDPSGPRPTKARTAGLLEDQLAAFYDDVDVSLLKYINRAAETIEAGKLLGGTKKATPDADSLPIVVRDLLSRGEITPDDAQMAEELIRSRYMKKGRIGDIARVAKSATHMMLLANPRSAITNLQDIALSVARNGSLNTLKGVAKALQGDIAIDLEGLGVKIFNEHLSDVGKLDQAVNQAFKKSGFETMDRFAKNVANEAALSKARKAVTSPKARQKLIEDFTSVYGAANMKQLMDELDAGEIGEMTKVHIFNELSEIQPISLLESPQLYNEVANGKLWYTLSMWTLNQYNFALRNGIREIKKGNVAKGTGALSALTILGTTAGIGTSYIKDVISGQDPGIESVEDRAISEFWKLVGLSRYAVEKGPAEMAQAAINMAPVTVVGETAIDLGSMLTDISEESKRWRLFRRMPIVGEMFYQWFGGGAEKANERKRERREELREEKRGGRTKERRDKRKRQERS